MMKWPLLALSFPHDVPPPSLFLSISFSPPFYVFMLHCGLADAALAQHAGRLMQPLARCFSVGSMIGFCCDSLPAVAGPNDAFSIFNIQLTSKVRRPISAKLVQLVTS